MDTQLTLTCIAEASHVSEFEVKLALVTEFLGPGSMSLAFASRLLGMPEGEVLALLTRRLLVTPYNRQEVETEIARRQALIKSW